MLAIGWLGGWLFSRFWNDGISRAGLWLDSSDCSDRSARFSTQEGVCTRVESEAGAMMSDGQGRHGRQQRKRKRKRAKESERERTIKS